MTPQPYRIAVSQKKLDTLKTKLALAEFPDELDESEWDMGVPLADMKRLTKAWEKWDWRQAEQRLNEIPQYHTSIKVDGFDELDIHFVWQKSKVQNAIPLLFVHGWPGSFLEVLPLLPLLSRPDGPAFDIIAPSLPNFGFSSSVKQRGFAAKQYAEVCHKLMIQLGYDQYVTQGGDWGFIITRSIGLAYPQHVKASHLNMFRGLPPTMMKNPISAFKYAFTPYSAREKAGLERTAKFADTGRGFYFQQCTRPQTIAYALNDSPTALLAWIYEKLHDWSDDYQWTDDEIFTWISVYHFSTAGPGAAGRIYYEVANTKEGPNSVMRAKVEEYIPGVKLGLAFNAKENFVLPKAWCRTIGDVVHESESDIGGHFFAHEQPKLLADDLRTMFGKGGGAFGVVQGKSGYAS